MKFLKQQKVLRSKAKKAEKVPESINTINTEIEKNVDFELTEDQLDVVNGGTINPAVNKGDDEG